MDDNTELRLLLLIAHRDSQLARLYEAAVRLVEKAQIPSHVTPASYSTADTKRVPSRALVALRSAVRALERDMSMPAGPTTLPTSESSPIPR